MSKRASDAAERAGSWPAPAAATLAAIRTRTATVGIVGLGYVGLPLALALEDAGFSIVGFDVDPQRASAVAAGIDPIGDGHGNALAAAVARGRFRAESNAKALAGCDAILVCVPTPAKDGRPDVSSVVGAARAIAPLIRSGVLVVLESTVAPHTTERVFLPLLSVEGLRPDTDFFVGFSPERIDPGSGRTFREVPKIVSGIGRYSAALTAALYETIVDEIVPVASPAEAELSKLLENIFRDVNIALVNELAVVADGLGIDIWEALRAAATKPYGYMPFRPGPGVGGHCIPVDPVYLRSHAAEEGLDTPVIDAARAVNDAMPDYVARRIDTLIDGVAGKKILCLGVTFKRDVSDCRNSPALRTLELLDRAGAEVRFHDPNVAGVRAGAHDLARVDSLDDALAWADCTLILVDHSSYDWTAVVNASRCVFDTRNVTAGLKRDWVFRL